MCCDLHRSHEHSRNDVESEEVLDESQRSRTKEDKEDLQSDIWDELRNLQDLVMVQGAELKRLTERVPAADRLVEALRKEIPGGDVSAHSKPDLPEFIYVQYLFYSRKDQDDCSRDPSWRNADGWRR